MTLEDELRAAETEAADRVAAASTLDELRTVESAHIGKRSVLAALNQRLGALDADARKEAGRLVNEARARVSALVDARREELAVAERTARLEPLG